MADDIVRQGHDFARDERTGNKETWHEMTRPDAVKRAGREVMDVRALPDQRSRFDAQRRTRRAQPSSNAGRLPSDTRPGLRTAQNDRPSTGPVVRSAASREPYAPSGANIRINCPRYVISTWITAPSSLTLSRTAKPSACS